METDKPNFRNVGTRVIGKIHKGKAHGPVLAATSIPSKYATELYEGVEEHNAFASRTQRFKTDSDKDVPGPGHYHQPSSLVKVSDSFSRKGYGNGFISKTARVPDSHKWGPGPGRYESKHAKELQTTKAFHRAPVTSAFSAPERAAVVDPRVLFPGPGQYTPQPLPKHPRRPRKKAFITRQITVTHMPDISAAGDGDDAGDGSGVEAEGFETKTFEAQEVVSSTVVLKATTIDSAAAAASPGQPAEQSHSGQKGRSHSAVLRPPAGEDQPFGTTAQRFHQSFTDVPAPGAYNPELPPARAATSAPFKSRAERYSLLSKASRDLPGPGTYEYALPGSDEIAYREAAASHFFKDSAIDRWGHPLEPRSVPYSVPAPGHYDPPKDSLAQLRSKTEKHHRALDTRARTTPQVLKAKLDIETNGEAQALAQAPGSRPLPMIAQTNVVAPGPAYYSPSVAALERRSFHYNPQKSFVSRV